MLKIGIIGTGYFGEIHLKVILELKNKFKLIGFNDVDKKRSQFITKTYNLTFFSLNELTIPCLFHKVISFLLVLMHPLLP